VDNVADSLDQCGDRGLDPALAPPNTLSVITLNFHDQKVRFVTAV
jgi:hypothetical protein